MTSDGPISLDVMWRRDWITARQRAIGRAWAADGAGWRSRRDDAPRADGPGSPDVMLERARARFHDARRLLARIGLETMMLDLVADRIVADALSADDIAAVRRGLNAIGMHEGYREMVG